MDIITLILVVGVILLLVQGARRDAILRRIEARLESLAEKSGVPVAEDASETVREFARRGDVAGAAAKYCAETGVDIDYARLVARRLARHLCRETPDATRRQLPG